MPSSPENRAPRAPLACADFEKIFDGYVDGTLDAGVALDAEGHVAACPMCDREVTRWQQTRILLSTAVADFATAVDVSTLHRDVFAAIGFEEKGDAAHRSASPAREAAASHRPASAAGRRGASAPGRSSATRAPGRLASFVRFTSAAVVSAAAAAAAVLAILPARQVAQPLLASAPEAGLVAATAAAPAATASRVRYDEGFLQPGERNSVFREVAAANHMPPPLARPEVSHVEGLEAAPGHHVSTWVQPRTNARVIWVQPDRMGTPVRTAGYNPR